MSVCQGSNAGIVREVSLQTFHIDEVAQTYNQPELFGIEILDDPEADLQLYHDYVAKEGMTQEEAAEMFEEMMQGFAEFLPLFTGDTILYFMQKSHYFLHLARGATPASFEAECRARTTARESRGASPALAVGECLRLIELPYGYNEVRRTLATPLARAVRPDFLTGRFDAHAAETAALRLAPIAPRRRVLAYDGDAAEFCELSPDGARALEALRQAGSLGALLDTIDPALDANGAARAKLESFAMELHRLGILAPTGRTGAGVVHS